MSTQTKGPRVTPKASALFVLNSLQFSCPLTRASSRIGTTSAYLAIVRALVARVLKGRNRIETERFVALRSHYGFESSYCPPGESGAHEKGGIEGEVGRQRRHFFTPIPKARSLADLNRRLEEADRRDLTRHIGHRRETVGAMGVVDRAALQPLPEVPFDFARIAPEPWSTSSSKPRTSASCPR